MEITRNRVVGTFVARGVLGLIFLMQGYGKVFRWGVARVYQNGFAPYEETFLPTWLLKLTAYYTSYVELTAGFLLLIGLWRNYALYALGSVLLIVSPRSDERLVEDRGNDASGVAVPSSRPCSRTQPSVGLASKGTSALTPVSFSVSRSRSSSRMSDRG